MRFVTAGESHGRALTTIISDVPSGVPFSEAYANAELSRRQKGYGRGGRMRIERDAVEILSGVRFGETIGSPITLQIQNKDWENWTDRMAVEGTKPEGIDETLPRPGHADLVGILKRGLDDCRDVLERASSRETAARVAAGSVAKALLGELGVEVFSFVRRIGEVALEGDAEDLAAGLDQRPLEDSPVRCPDEAVSQAMCDHIDAARKAGDTLGGEIVIVARGLVAGLGDYTSSEKRLTSRLGGALFSIPAIKGVSFGAGFGGVSRPGSEIHDPIAHDVHRGFYRTSNNAGGLEGGMTNGEDLIATIAMKPIPTLMKPLSTVDLRTLEPAEASKERSDACAVPAAGVVAEAEVAVVLASAYCEKFGADSLTEMLENLEGYAERIAR